MSRKSVFFISHITLRDCRVHFSPTTFLETGVYNKANTFPLSKDAKLSSVCAVPVDDWFPLAKDAGTKVPQCAWPNLEGGATVEKTASVKSERFHHRYTAAPLLSHLPQYTWVVTEKSLKPITKILLSRI